MNELIKGEEKIRKLIELIEDGESILRVIIYKCPHYPGPLTKFIFHYYFVVFETNNWWWSVDKNSEGITIQSSKEIEYVRDKFGLIDRLTPVIQDQAAGNEKTMKQFFQYLIEKGELMKEYHFIKNNCKTFSMMYVFVMK